MLSHVIFVVLALVSIGLFTWKMSSIIKQIKLGRPANRTDRTGERIKTMLLVAFGQKKMFNRPIPAILHFISMWLLSLHKLNLLKFLLMDLVVLIGFFTMPDWGLFIPL